MALPGRMPRKRWPADVESGTTLTVCGDGTDASHGEPGIQGEHFRLTDCDAEAVACSLSDMSISGSSDGFEQSSKTDMTQKSANAPPSPVDLPLEFLPPAKSRPQCAMSFMCSKTETAPEIESANPISFNATAPSDYFSLIQDFDLSSMREKLEAQKEFLFDSFEKQPVLPHAFSLRNNQRDYKTKELHSLKWKGRLHRLGRAARHFLNTKIFRQQPAMQRCEIQLIGFDDQVERLVLMISLHHGTRNDKETMHVSLPSFFETNRVLVPRFLLPRKQGERVTVAGYGIAGQDEASPFADFREVVVSGVCTIQFESRPLLSGMLVLQPHRPSRSLIGLGRAVQSGETHMKTTQSESAGTYTFSTHPAPVALDFTELCLLQTADPFKEYLALSASTCDRPATFQVALSPGQYHSVCSYRLTASSLREVFTVAAAPPAAYFRAYPDKAMVTEHMNQAAEQTAQGVSRRPVLCPTLLLVRPPGLDMEGLMRMLGSGHADRINISAMTNTKTNTAKPNTSELEQGLYFCAWNMDRDDADVEGSTAVTKSWYPFTMGWTAVRNPRLPPGSREYTHLPSLSVFNVSMHLYFADYWTFYDKHYVTLVVCAKGSPCHQVCKRHLQKLDPYNNPFLFRRRYYDPEPSVVVYASASVNVELIYSDSAAIQQLVFACSENVYFSKVHVDDSTNV